jgi:hypothetical protein
MSSASAASSSINEGFIVYIRPMIGQDIIIENCKDDTRVSYLIDNVRRIKKRMMKNADDENNYTRPVLTMRSNNSFKRLKANSTLGENKIVNGTVLDVLYNLDPSCHHPFLSGNTFPAELHRCIENGDEEMDHITFKMSLSSGILEKERSNTEAQATAHKFYNEHKLGQLQPLNLSGMTDLALHNPVNINTDAARNISPLLVYHNEWKWDKETLFYLSNTPKDHFKSIDLPSNITKKSIRYEPFSGYYEDNDKFALLYSESEIKKGKSILVQNGSSVQGILKGITLRILQTYGTEYYRRVFDIYVHLEGPITIIGPDNVPLKTSNITSIRVPYHYIVMCDESERLSLSRDISEEKNDRGAQGNNRNTRGNNRGARGLNLRFGPPAGGRRRTKRSKLTKHKRKTHGRSRK